MYLLAYHPKTRLPWNKGRLIGQKPPLKPHEIWSIRVRLQIAMRSRDLTLFNIALDSKLRGCDIVRLRLSDVALGGKTMPSATVVQKKTGLPVKFELSEQTRVSVDAWIKHASLDGNDYLFPSRFRRFPHLSTRQYARIVKSWVSLIGLDPGIYGTHSLRRTKATLIYRVPLTCVSWHSLSFLMATLGAGQGRFQNNLLSHRCIKLG